MTKKRKCFLKWIKLCLISLTVHSATAQPEPLDMKKALSIALENNYSLRSDSLNISTAYYKTRELSGLNLPQVNYGSKTEYNIFIPPQMLPGTIVGQPSKDFVPVQLGTKYNINGGIEVTQNIIRKDLKYQLQSAGLNISISRTKYNLTKEELVYQLASLFYNLQTSAELIRTTTNDYNNLKKVVDIARAQFEAGTLKRIDYESLQINLANKQSQLSQLRTSYYEQLNYFKYLLGLPVESEITITNKIISSDLPAGRGQMMQREDIHLSRQLIEATELEIKTLQAEKLPVLGMYYKYNYQAQFNKPGKLFNNDYWSKSSSIGLSMSIPIFDGNRRKNRNYALQAQLQQLKFQSEYQMHYAQTELYTAMESLSSNRELFEITKQNLALAEKVFSSRTALYTEGVTTLIELLDAETELSQSRNLYIQAMINVQTKVLDVHKANGTLLTDFIKSL